MAPEVKQQQDVPVESSKPSLDNVINTALTDRKLTSKEIENISQKYQEYLDGKADIKDETKNSLKQFLTNSKGSANFEKFKKVMLTKLDSKPTVAPANAAPKALKDAAPANSIPVAGKDAAPANTAPESTETSKVTYKLDSENVIKNAMLNLDETTNPFAQQIIGTYTNENGETKNIVLKGSSTNLRVELDGSGALNDTDLLIEKSGFESIKMAVTTLIEKYKKDVSSKKGKSKDTKGERVQETVNENEKKVDTFIKLDGKSANIMLFRYANQNNGDSINDKPYRYTVELDKSDKFIDPSIDFDHEPTADELKTAISKLKAEYETYKTEEKQNEAKTKESEAKSKLEKENQGKITEITKSVEELKFKPSDIAPQGFNKDQLDQWSQWIKEFSNTNEIMLNVTSIDLSNGTINFDFDDSSINEKFNTNLSISGVIKDGKLDVAAFKKAIPEQVGNAIKAMVKQQTEVKK